MAIRYKLALMDTIECNKKEYATQSMGELEELLGCKIKRDLTKMIINIFQPYLMNKITQGFNKGVK